MNRLYAVVAPPAARKEVDYGRRNSSGCCGNGKCSSLIIENDTNNRSHACFCPQNKRDAKTATSVMQRNFGCRQRNMQTKYDRCRWIFQGGYGKSSLGNSNCVMVTRKATGEIEVTCQTHAQPRGPQNAKPKMRHSSLILSWQSMLNGYVLQTTTRQSGYFENVGLDPTIGLPVMVRRSFLSTSGLARLRIYKLKRITCSCSYREHANLEER